MATWSKSHSRRWGSRHKCPGVDSQRKHRSSKRCCRFLQETNLILQHLQKICLHNLLSPHPVPFHFPFPAPCRPSKSSKISILKESTRISREAIGAVPEQIPTNPKSFIAIHGVSSHHPPAESFGCVCV